MYLFLAFLLVPLVEIALFIQVGGLIGLWPTLAVVILTAVLGTALVRGQGRQTMFDLRRSFNELDDPTEPLAHGAMILVAGVLLLTPGFFTDALGFALLMPPVRLAVMRHARTRMTATTFQIGTAPRGAGMSRHDTGMPPRGDVIDGEFEEVQTQRDPNRPPSGWTRD
ncbi:FxsA family protein [Pukyongiella litopenaei]|uniref:FxsA family protein n=1 Tax=Pukyongiella litopenaei TaxID=2605946 RepID=A0A2S0MPP3_9RHOB|nr:FxsA family protein [Pukyongiella litopenaei]AVO37838.1 FxsA family protein [Pukyongiella litopenaei]